MIEILLTSANNEVNRISIN
jgi:transcriptional regulator with XRE-family HTH domain